jgi:SAM-dependent methyltransferase
MTNGVTATIGVHLREAVAKMSDPAEIHELNKILRLMARWRSALLVNTFRVREGRAVLNGPFAGMTYATYATEGAMMPRLLGTYESELHPHLLRFADEGVDCVIDVGCAEGYYAVGLARLMPQARVYAYDISEEAREACATNAADNGVQDRVTIGGEFRPADFEAFAGRKALVVMDCEGAEDDLLRPDLSPALAGMRLIVETHEGHRPGVRQRLIDRFAATHEVTVVDLEHKTHPLPDWIRELGHLDQLLAVWEFRGGPTPWLVLTPKA